jgi:ferredoxin/flavodoxin---NADP+ reductase
MKNWKEKAYSYATVLENKMIADGAYLLHFEREFDFEAGQVIALGVTPEIAPRLYSIAGGEQDPMAEILYTEKSNGELTPLLSPLKPGERLMVSEPFGKFTKVSQSAVYVAAGTGIAPFMSMIRSGKAPGATLIHGASYPEYFYYADELEKLLGRNYIPCCSRSTDERFYNGRVTRFLEQWDKTGRAKKYYLCGSAEMVVETRDVLISRGVPFDAIEAEIFF